MKENSSILIPIPQMFDPKSPVYNNPGLILPPNGCHDASVCHGPFQATMESNHFVSVRVSTCFSQVHTLWPGDAIWCHEFLIKLVQVVACVFWGVPIHYLNQCRLIISWILGYYLWSNFKRKCLWNRRPWMTFSWGCAVLIIRKRGRKGINTAWGAPLKVYEHLISSY